MNSVKISELEKVKEVGPEFLIPVVDTSERKTKTITIQQLLGIQQEALNEPCKFCGSRGKFDVRGNCGACGAPVKGEE